MSILHDFYYLQLTQKKKTTVSFRQNAVACLPSRHRWCDGDASLNFHPRYFLQLVRREKLSCTFITLEVYEAV